MIVTCKEGNKLIQKKIEYSAFDPSPEEIKDYKLKSLNYDSINEYNKCWKEQNLAEFEKH